MTTRRKYTEVLKSKSLQMDSSDSEGCLRSQDSKEVVQPSPSTTQSSGRRRQRRRRNASEGCLRSQDTEEVVQPSPSTTQSSESPSSPDGSSSTQSEEEDAIPIPDNKLFVGEIPRSLREKDLAKLFEAFGEVKHARLHRNKDGTSKVLIEFLAFPSFLCYRTLSLTLSHPHQHRERPSSRFGTRKTR